MSGQTAAEVPQRLPPPDLATIDVSHLPETVAIGRPQCSSYTPQLFESICQGMEEGRSGTIVCKEHGVPFSNVLYWRDMDKRLAERLAHAQRQQAHAIFEKMKADAAKLQDRDDWMTWAAERKVDPKMINALVSAVDKGLARNMDIIKRICPDEYGDVIKTHNINETLIYAVLFNPDGQPEQGALTIEQQKRPKSAIDCQKAIGKPDSKAAKTG